MVEKEFFKKTIVAASMAVVVAGSTIMTYAASFTRELELGDSWMSSYISAYDDVAIAELTTGVTSDLSIDGEAEFKDQYGYSEWKYLIGGTDQSETCTVSTRKSGVPCMYAEATFRAYGNNDANKSDFINCSNY